MGILRKFASTLRSLLFPSSAGERSSPVATTPVEDDQPWTLRRWEASRTDRLNKAHWQGAHGQSINQDLSSELPTLRARCAYELANNPILEGMVNTYCIDCVGPEGPRLQVLSGNPDYNTAVERIWNKWFAKPEVTGQMTGPDLLRLWVRQLFSKGEYLAQKVTDETADGPVQFRLLCQDPDRLATPPQFLADAQVALGVRVTKTGKPTQYYLREEQSYGAFVLPTSRYFPVPADMMLHGFTMLEAGQVRGVPWLASGLPIVADLRDYDTQVLDAARSAADQCLWFFTEHPDAPYMQINESTKMERRTASTAPPGWKPFMVNPTQPATNYVQYRTERLRELGRPINMPLMMVRLGSEDHNYSSARFDGQIYQRGIFTMQVSLFNPPLTRCLEEVMREAELAGELPPKPSDVSIHWLHNKPPHVDPSKEANAERTYLENGTLTLAEALAAQGKDFEEHMRQLETIAARLKKIGIVLAWQQQEVDQTTAPAEEHVTSA